MVKLQAAGERDDDTGASAATASTGTSMATIHTNPIWGKFERPQIEPRSYLAILQSGLRAANCEKVVSWLHDVTATTEKLAKADEGNHRGDISKPTSLLNRSHSSPSPALPPQFLHASALLVRLAACAVGDHPFLGCGLAHLGSFLFWISG